MMQKKKVIFETNPELHGKLKKTSQKMMIPMTSVVKLAINRYCDEVLVK